MTWKSTNFTVDTYDGEGLTDAKELSKIYVERIANALVSLHENWEISQQPEYYIENPTDTTLNGTCSTVELLNKATGEYVRLWYVAAGVATTPGTGNYTAYLLSFYPILQPSSDTIASYGGHISVYIGNCLVTRGYYATNTHKEFAAPSGLIIGVSSSHIEKRLDKDLHLNIPLFGFAFRNIIYGNAYITISSPDYWRCHMAQLGNARVINNSSEYHTAYYSWRSVDRFAVATDGENFYIIDKVLVNQKDSQKNYNAVLYSRMLFDNADNTDTRKDGAISFCSGFSYQTNNSCVYVDKNGNKLGDGSYNTIGLSAFTPASLSGNDTIYYGSYKPSLSKNSYSYNTVFGSSSPSKGKFSTDFVRCCDPDVVKYGNTLDGGKWVCVQDGVLFPSDPSNPSLV